MGQARAILGLDQVDQQLYVYRETLEKSLSVRQVEQLVKNMLEEKGNSSNKSNTSKIQLPPSYKRIEDNMASHFSTKVKLERKKNGKGAVTIEFYSDEDLERIMDKMNL